MSANDFIPRLPMVLECTVAPADIPALIGVAQALQERDATLSGEQLKEMILLRGITGWVNDLNLHPHSTRQNEGALHGQ